MFDAIMCDFQRSTYDSVIYSRLFRQPGSKRKQGKQGSCLEKEIMQGTMPGARRRGRPRTAWIDNIKTWTELSVEESVRKSEDRDKWRKYVHCVANLRIEDG